MLTYSARYTIHKTVHLDNHSMSFDCHSRLRAQLQSRHYAKRRKKIKGLNSVCNFQSIKSIVELPFLKILLLCHLV